MVHTCKSPVSAADVTCEPSFIKLFMPWSSDGASESDEFCACHSVSQAGPELGLKWFSCLSFLSNWGCMCIPCMWQLFHWGAFELFSKIRCWRCRARKYWATILVRLLCRWGKLNVVKYFKWLELNKFSKFYFNAFSPFIIFKGERNLEINKYSF